MQINIKTLTGATFNFNFDPTNTIYQIKLEIQEKQGIDVQQIRLIYGGRQLDDDQTIQAAGIKPGDTINMILQLKGGF